MSMSRRQAESAYAYLITEASEEAIYQAERSGMFREIAYYLGMGQSHVHTPVMTTWVQPAMWGLAQK